MVLVGMGSSLPLGGKFTTWPLRLRRAAGCQRAATCRLPFLAAPGLRCATCGTTGLQLTSWTLCDLWHLPPCSCPSWPSSRWGWPTSLCSTPRPPSPSTRTPRRVGPCRPPAGPGASTLPAAWLQHAQRTAHPELTRGRAAAGWACHRARCSGCMQRPARALFAYRKWLSLKPLRLWRMRVLLPCLAGAVPGACVAPGPGSRRPPASLNLMRTRHTTTTIVPTVADVPLDLADSLDRLAPEGSKASGPPLMSGSGPQPRTLGSTPLPPPAGSALCLIGLLCTAHVGCELLSCWAVGLLGAPVVPGPGTATKARVTKVLPSRFCPPHQPWPASHAWLVVLQVQYRHDDEGPDDMPAHVKVRTELCVQAGSACLPAHVKVWAEVSCSQECLFAGAGGRRAWQEGGAVHAADVAAGPGKRAARMACAMATTCSTFVPFSCQLFVVALAASPCLAVLLDGRLAHAAHPARPAGAGHLAGHLPERAQAGGSCCSALAC